MKINIDKQKLEELISSNWHRKEIAEFFHVSEKTISKRIKEYGLTFKKETKQKEVHKCERCGKEYVQSKYHPYCCKKCAGLLDLTIYAEPITELGKQVVELRKQGKTFKEISEILHCSKATVSYYCSNGNREHKLEYSKSGLEPYIKRIVKSTTAFQNRKPRNKVRFKCQNWYQSFKSRVSNFVGNWENKNKMKAEKRFGYKEVLDYIGGWETKCYLTGRYLDLRVDDYEFDHIVPISKGGSCELSNLGITCAEANQAKADTSLEDFIQLCKEVLVNYGYKVEKL